MWLSLSSLRVSKDTQRARPNQFELQGSVKGQGQPIQAKRAVFCLKWNNYMDWKVNDDDCNSLWKIGGN
ncbi:hypothetical protein D5086_010315 [Populus alba]|uniref:Uncharacterized protein n=1 Tax=Populus alba TaxID=43335 RepID=A0ACC4CAT0_POPAL